MPVNTPKAIIVHTSDVSYKLIKDQFVSINQYHRDVRLFPISSLGYYVGYHSLCTGGRNYRPRADEDEGAHCNAVVNGVSMNFQSLGICIGFDGDIEPPLPEDVANAKAQIKAWKEKYNIPVLLISPHRRYQPNKTCYGSLLADDWARNLIVEPEPVVTEMQKRLSLLQKILALYQQIMMLRAKLPSGKILFGTGTPTYIGGCCERG